MVTKAKGFTLVELLVVIAIIGILVGLLFEVGAFVGKFDSLKIIKSLLDGHFFQEGICDKHGAFSFSGVSPT